MLTHTHTDKRDKRLKQGVQSLGLIWNTNTKWIGFIAPLLFTQVLRYSQLWYRARVGWATPNHFPQTMHTLCRNDIAFPPLSKPTVQGQVYRQPRSVRSMGWEHFSSKKILGRSKMVLPEKQFYTMLHRETGLSGAPDHKCSAFNLV